jgi:hypothetical protein
MERYKNLSGNSSVSAYEIGQSEITVKFTHGGIYLYTNQSAGEACIIEMQRLAAFGQGLNSYIGRFIRKGYARKWH